MRKYLWLLVLIMIPAEAQQTRYVGDNLQVTVRTGQSTSHQIVVILNAGAKLELLEEGGEYSRVRTEGGKEGWVLSQYLSTQPIARDRLVRVEAQLQQLQSQSTELQTQLAGLEAEKRNLEALNQSLNDENRELANQLAKLTELAARPAELEQENQQIKTQLSAQTEELEALRAHNQRLIGGDQREWFLVGGGVSFASVLLGLLLGLVVNRLKKRRWGEL